MNIARFCEKTKLLYSLRVAFIWALVFVIPKISIYGNTKETEIVGTVKEDVVNIRSGPSTDYAIIGKMERGEKVNILSEENGWYVIKYKGDKGYIYRELVDKE